MQSVISHYKQKGDSLEYKAALFLIDNMGNKYSYDGTQYRSFLNFIDSISTNFSSIEMYKEELSAFSSQYGSLTGTLIKRLDSNTLRTDFLIKNIDQAVKIYRTAPWCKKMSFSEFCEYVLPYRIGNERLEAFRDSFITKFNYLLSDSTLDRKQAADSVLKITSQHGIEILEFPGSVPDFPPSILEHLKGGTCREVNNLAIYVMRSIGIPVADDFTPQWPHRGHGHSWTSLIIKEDSCIDFGGSTSLTVGGHLKLSNSNRMAKAYRHTYARQPSSLAMQNGNEDIPEFFKDPYLKDVSNLYFRGRDIKMKINNTTDKSLAYLCVFNNWDWVPIQWSFIKKDSAIFRGMGKPAVYLPAIYLNGKTSALNNNPILIDSFSKITALNADTINLQTLVLKRKYPVFDWWNTRNKALQGGRFQASKDSNFTSPLDVYIINEVPEMTFQEFNLDADLQYRYWRYLSPDSSYGEIAEVELYDDDRKLSGERIIGSKGNSKKRLKESVFDGDPLTFFQSDKPSKNWVGLAFPKPQRVTRIRYLCRNDDNFIRSG
ncbi:MAG: hypothetical protein H3C64_13050, partial [Candidatus Kuenenia stuttgartiensis]|nr:hypothetical protein [Candidatus Kuenenia stuttgartiensis]